MNPAISLPGKSHLQREELDALHDILRPAIRSYVDQRIMGETVQIPPAVRKNFLTYVRKHPHITLHTYADILYRLTLGSVYNCFQGIRKSVRDPSNTALASQLSIEIALQLPFFIRPHCSINQF